MADKLNLDPVTIVNKQFGVDFKGYDPNEVDRMLDLIIEDYETYQNMIDSLKEKISDLERSNATMRARMIELEGEKRAEEKDGDPMKQGAGNIDILKRLTRLENTVFSNSSNKTNKH